MFFFLPKLLYDAINQPSRLTWPDDLLVKIVLSWIIFEDALIGMTNIFSRSKSKSIMISLNDQKSSNKTYRANFHPGRR